MWGPSARAALVWVVRATARNRLLVARYPEVFATRFPGSSRAWVAALTAGGPIPTEPGLVWCDADDHAADDGPEGRLTLRNSEFGTPARS